MSALFKSVVIVLILINLISCQPKDETTQQELAAIKQELSHLRGDIANIGSQIKEIHNIATESQQPKFPSVPTQANVDNDGQLPSIGDTQAKIAILEFSDFQCPYCKRYVDNTFTKIKAEYIDTGKVKYLTRSYPLSFHAKAQGAAIAASCAQQQQAYWKMRDALFTNMTQLSDDLYQKTATNLSLDMTQFNTCLKDEAVAKNIASDLAYGASIGVQGTPSFMVGRVTNNQLIEPKLLVGAQNFETFAMVIEDLLKQ